MGGVGTWGGSVVRQRAVSRACGWTGSEAERRRGREGGREEAAVAAAAAGGWRGEGPGGVG